MASFTSISHFLRLYTCTHFYSTFALFGIFLLQTSAKAGITNMVFALNMVAFQIPNKPSSYFLSYFKGQSLKIRRPKDYQPIPGMSGKKLLHYFGI